MKNQLEITVKRPNGAVETLIHPVYTWWSEAHFAAAKEATREAGRGEILSYRNLIDGRDESVVKAEAAAEAAKPVWVERRRVSALFARAAKLQDYPGEYFPALHEAEAALRAWQAKYPAEAAVEERDRLIAEAERLESLAIGALVYDADGSLSAAEQQARHDAYKAKAAAIRREAQVETTTK